MKTFAQLVACLLAVGFVVLSFRCLRKDKDIPATKFALYSFGALVAAILIGDGGSFFATMPAIEQLVCWFFALWYLRLAFDLAKVKDGLGYAFVVLLISSFSFFCGMSGVQAFLKTHMLMTVKDSFIAYGEKLDRFQTNVIEMRQDLSDRQDDLNTNQFKMQIVLNLIKDKQIEMAEKQLTISNDYQRLLTLSNKLEIVEAKIIEQYNGLTNVQSDVNTLFSNGRDDIFSNTNTDKFVLMEMGTSKLAIFKLSSAPIPFTLQGMVMNARGQQVIVPAGLEVITNNVVMSNVGEDSDLSHSTFVFRYIVDTSKTNLIQKVVDAGLNVITLDGSPIRLHIK